MKKIILFLLAYPICGDMQGAALGSRLQVCIGNILQELLWFLLRWEDVCAQHHHHYKCGH